MFTCVVLWTKTHLGDGSFTVASRKVWNILPASLAFDYYNNNNYF